MKRQTGDVLWRTQLGKTPDRTDAPTFVDSKNRIALTSTGNPTIYDVGTGVGTPVTAETPLVCRRDRPILKLSWLGSHKRYEYAIGQDVEPCDLNGKAIAEIPADWVPSAGIDAGSGRWLLPTPEGLTLVQLS